jgi:hypothetical protein
MRAQARAHRQAVEAELRQLSFAETIARGMGSGAVGRLGRAYGVALAVLCCTATIGFMAPSFGADEDVGRIAMVAFVGGLVLLMGLFFLGLRWAIRNDALDEETAAPPPPLVPTGEMAVAKVAGVCSRCGAQVFFLLASSSAHCSYCGATALPSAAIQRRLGALLSFHSDLRSGRESRRGVRVFSESRVWRALGWGVRHMFVFVPLMFGVILGQAMLRAPSPPPRPLFRPPPGFRPHPVAASNDTTIGAAVLGGSILLTLVLVVGIVLSERPGRFSSLDALARLYGARVDKKGVDAAIAWLDTYWASPTPAESLAVPEGLDGDPRPVVAVALFHRGVPVLLLVAETPHVHRLEVFASGYEPGRGEHAQSPAAYELRSAGLRVTLGPAGAHLGFIGSDARFCAPGVAMWMLDRAVSLASGSSPSG